ncbi:hypothetical protein BDW67DRAFT_155123 [Aspergillus spinulosporus]
MNIGSGAPENKHLDILARHPIATQFPTCDAIYGVIVSLTTIVLAGWGILCYQSSYRAVSMEHRHDILRTLHECCRGEIHEINERRQDGGLII